LSHDGMRCECSRCMGVDVSAVAEG
jgi:hypothetical protein